MANADDDNGAGDGAGDGVGDGSVRIDSPVPEGETSSRDSIQIVGEQNQANRKIMQIAGRYSSGSGTGGTTTYQQEKVLLEAGMDQEKLKILSGKPREWFVRSYNAFYPVERRLEKRVEESNGAIASLVAEERTQMVDLYGPNYDRLSTNGVAKVGGLHGKYQDLAERVYTTAQDLVSLRGEIRSTSARQQELERMVETVTDPKEQRKVNTHYLALGIDLSRYASLEAELAGKLEGYEESLKMAAVDIRTKENELTRTQSDIRRARLSVQKIGNRREYHVQRRSNEEARGKLQASLQQAAAIINSRAEYDTIQGRQQSAPKQYGLEVELADNPLQDETLAESEREGQELIDRMYQRAEEITKKPQCIIYQSKGKKS